MTSYEMLGRQTCEACCAGGPSASKANKCSGPDSCMAARGFKVGSRSYPTLNIHRKQHSSGQLPTHNTSLLKHDMLTAVCGLITFCEGHL